MKGLAIIIPAFVLIYFIKHLINKSKYDKVEQEINMLTSKKVLDTLSLEQKRQVATIVELRETNYSSFKDKVKDDLTYMGLGYAVSDMGFSKAVRYGVGYRMIRRLLKKPIYKATDPLVKGDEDIDF
jgi:hypothetical protein